MEFLSSFATLYLKSLTYKSVYCATYLRLMYYGIPTANINPIQTGLLGSSQTGN